MPSKNSSRRWLIVPALFLAFCSRGNSPSLTSPSGGSARVVTNADAIGTSGDQGIVGALAAGDVKNGPIEIDLVKLSQIDTVPEPDRELVLYASAGGVYAVRTNLEVEIYVQIWTSDTELAEAPRLIIDWGVGGGVNERDRIHCGPCRVSRTYNKEGLYTVTVTMDDRVGGTTSRTFTLDVRQPVAEEPGGPVGPANCAAVASTTTYSYSGAIINHVVPAGVFSMRMEALGAGGGNSTWAAPVSGGKGASMMGCFAVVPGQTLRILVGQAGESAAVGGGGGGSFVASGTTPLLVAGGGGGASFDQNGVDAVTAQNGTASSSGFVLGGTNGNGGAVCIAGANNGGGGGGFLTDGADANPGAPQNGGFGGKSFLNGGAGGIPGRLGGGCSGDAFGGFGGGGSTSCNTVGGGGGGGYSGGAGGQHIGNCSAGPREGGGGGGSFNSGSSQTNTAGVNAGNGTVTLTW